MTQPLRALIVEDSENDAELLIHELTRGGYDLTYERVETPEAMTAALEHSTWDIIISDYSMPRFSAPRALDLMQALHCDLPFIIVSGTIGEETAVSALKAGAHDFLVKGRLARLIPAIERELRDAAARRDHQQLHERLRQNQKVELLGQLAGSVAHDFNNVLTVILGFCELLIEDLHADTPERGDVLEIQKAGQRGAGLTRQLLSFSRQQVLQPKVHDLNALVSDVSPMLRQLIFENIDLTVSLMPDVGLLRVDAVQLEQILINLVVNARDAMPRGGKVAISTGIGELDASTRQTHALADGHYLRLTVTDTGTGMDEATKRRLFEPFFTTKGPGKGTGIGMATVDGIVKQNGGHIEVDSEVGCGTTFTIYLPRLMNGTLIHSDSLLTSDAPRGTETVLVAEDDPAVRLLARLSLLRCGYQVLEAGNPEEAVRVALDFVEPIHLLLSDVIMPQSEGAPLIERLRNSRPDLRLLYMSGYTDEAIVHHGVLDEGIPFLQKPFTPHALAQKVREVLDAVG
jgi:signal transduction histidine kinase